MEYMLRGYDVSEERPVRHLVGFLRSLVYLLPCERCRVHWGQILEQHPPEPHMQTVPERLAWFRRVRALATPRSNAKPQPQPQQQAPDHVKAAVGAIGALFIVGLVGVGLYFLLRRHPVP